MVWIIQKPDVIDSTREVFLQDDDDASLETDVVKWVKDIAAEEVKCLGELGIRALPLPVRCCGSMTMCQIMGAQDEVVEERVFNRVCLSTAFNLARTASLQTSTQVHCHEGTDGQFYFCNMCLMQIDSGKALNGNHAMVLSFPFVFLDSSNSLTHWALRNSKNEYQYIVRSNIRLPTATPASVQTSIGPTCKQPLHHGDQIMNAKLNGMNAFSVIRERWQQFTTQEQVDALSFYDADMLKCVLLDFRILVADAVSRMDPLKPKAESLSILLKEFPLLASLVFARKMGQASMMSVQPAFLQLSDVFWSILETLAPKLFSGKYRRRRSVFDWAALWERPARDFARLQQRVAQLIEQQLWSLADGGVSQPLRRRRKAPAADITKLPACVSSQRVFDVASEIETAFLSDINTVENLTETSSEIAFDDDEIDCLLRECFVFRHESTCEDISPRSEPEYTQLPISSVTQWSPAFDLTA